MNNKSLIIGVLGRAGSGKDVFAEIARSEFGAEKLAFADSLKEEVYEFLVINKIYFEYRNLYGSQADKEEYFILPDLVIEKNPFLISFNNNYRKSFRSLLQFWGTDYRRAQDDLYWVKKCLAKCSNPDKLYVISDVRFRNEAEGIKILDGKLIKIVRPYGIKISNMDHASETELDNWIDLDNILLNDGTLEDYENLSYRVLRRIIDENK